MIYTDEIKDYYENSKQFHPRRSRSDDVKGLQIALREKGFDLKIDGVFGKGTISAMRSFQKRKK